MQEHSKIRWAEPRWSYRARLKSELATVFRVDLWLRIMLWVILITAGMAYAVKKDVPDLQFNWFRALAASLGVFAIYFGSFVALIWFLPPLIQINHKGITRQHGNSVGWRLPKDIQSITVDARDSCHPHLCVICPDKKPWDLGIGEKVNILELVNCLRDNFSHALIEVKK